MPTSNHEAANTLDSLRKERDLSRAWIARRIGRNEMWVSRKLNGKVPITIDDYNLLLRAIESVTPEVNR
ncbi:helix-turn-helix domain-containing protein [Leucobacter sp. NPDC058333]|uniref:helix-turn-helix domain-containing protein n=1 Tax=Leucobacter sp. NPDC058333 TaxID=3346450 RepID=UPI00366529DE